MMNKKVAASIAAIKKVTRKHVNSVKAEIKNKTEVEYFRPLYLKRIERLDTLLSAYLAQFKWILEYAKISDNKMSDKQIIDIRDMIEVIDDACLEAFEFSIKKAESKAQMESDVRSMKIALQCVQRFAETHVYCDEPASSALTFLDRLYDVKDAGAHRSLDYIDAHNAHEFRVVEGELRHYRYPDDPTNYVTIVRRF